MTPINALMWLLAFVFIIVAMAHVQLHADTNQENGLVGADRYDFSAQADT